MGHISTKTELFAYTNKIYVRRFKEETLKPKNTDHFNPLELASNSGTDTMYAVNGLKLKNLEYPQILKFQPKSNHKLQSYEPSDPPLYLNV